ncbi:uncharacterized protein METZ01_LOCUS277865 [marine metagenome]|uniref:Uncharacterized protein n=1 Tax=marine metagenome TaxID=408172 RepID=A0A382KQR6_9ZZZZ
MDLTTGLPDDIRTNNLFDSIVTPFDQNIRQDLLQQRLRCVLIERNNPVDTSQPCQHRHASLKSINRSAFPFQTMH